MHGEERDRFLLRVGSALDGARLVGPRRCHRLGEGAQAAHGVPGRQAEIEIDIGERALGLAAMALEEERADAHHVHGMREQLMRGRAVTAPGERLQPLDDLASERVRDDSGVDAEIKARNPIRPFL